MILQINLEDGPRCKAVEIARQRYNVENSNAPGFTLATDMQAFVQKITDRLVDAYVQRYLSAPQTLAEAIARIEELESRNDALRKELATAPPA